MYDYDQIERIVMSVLQSSPDVFQQDGNVLKFKGDVIYNPNPNPGPKGDRGPQGESGEKGDKGEKGDVGPQGPKGDSIIIPASKGDKGDKGDRGPQGINGKDGIVPNITSTVSINGSSGTPSCTVTRTENAGSINFHFAFSGLKGAQGQKGDTGAQGPQGIRGPQGIQGPQGNPGQNGDPGQNGKPGENGKDADTTTIRNIIDEVKSQIYDEINRIDNFVNNLNDEVQSDAERIINDINWIKETFPNGSGSQSNFGSQDVEEYLQMIAQWKDNSEARWSVISQTVNDITAEVNSIKQNGIDYESLVGKLYSYITGEETITTEMQSTWSRFLGLGENNIQLLEWMASGIKSQANSKEAIADLFASAKNMNSEAYAGLEARISNIEGSYVSSTSISSMVKDEITTSISGLFTENSKIRAIANLYSRLKNAEDSIAGLNLETTIDGKVLASLFAEGGAGRSAITEEVNDYMSKLNLNVEGGDLSAFIELLVNDKMSSVTISADQIDLKGKTWAEVINLSSEDLFSGNNIVISPSEIQVVGTSTKQGYSTTINESGIEFYASSTWGSTTSMISYNSFTFPGLSYQTTHPTLGNGNLTITNGNIVVVGENAKIKTPMLTTDDNLLITSNYNGSVTIGATNIYFNADNSIIASPSISSSDENLKNIISNIDASIEDIASTRIINYELKKNPGKINVGTIAQDWQNIVPNAVKVIDDEQHLGLNYSSTALISAVTAAREIVKLKQENEQLKERLSDLEDKINNFN